jgi:uncharacterized repeat protein (TIGR01451 family)
MSNYRRNQTVWAWLAIALLCLAGLAGWFSSTRGMNASGGLPMPQTFASPIGPAQLSLSKRVDNNAPLPGTQINYTLSYSNTTLGAQAFNVRLYDFVPAGVQFVSSNPPATPDAHGVLLFTAPFISGTQDYSVTVQALVLPGYPQLTNYALVMADFVTPTDTSLVTTVAQPPPGKLRLTKTGYPVALMNSQLVYVLTCDNIGGTTVTSVSLVDVLPSSVALVGASPAPNSVTPPLLRWSLGDLAPGASHSVMVTVTTPLVPSVITNTAIADALQAAMTTTLYSTQVVTQATILQVVKQGSAPQVSVGDALVYTLSYSNIGNQGATGVILTDTLPSGVTLVGASPTPNGSTSQSATWLLNSLGAGAQGQVVLTVTVGLPANRTLHNAADITGQPGSIAGHAEWDTAVKPIVLYLPLVIKTCGPDQLFC